MPRIAVVIVNYRTPELVEMCLDAIAGSGEDAEVVVVDNGSGDGSVARLCARCDCKVLELRGNRGFAVAVNAGVAATIEDPVVVLNSDTRPEPGALSALAEALREDADAGFVAPVLVHADGEPQPSAYRQLPTLRTVCSEVAIAPGYVATLLPRLRLGNAVAPHDVANGATYSWIMGAAFATTRCWWHKTGPFDENYFLYFEETDWQRRLRRGGGKVGIVHDARVEHLLRAGDPLMAVVSPHWITSARRYLKAQGVPTRITAAGLQMALVLAWLTSWSAATRGHEGRLKARQMRQRIRALRGPAVGRGATPEGPGWP